ncbi:pitrilysin family protein [soil metagenome]
MSEEILSRSNPPSLQQIEDFSFQHVEKRKLDNGIPVFIMNAGVQDVLKAELIFTNPAFNPAQPLLHSAVNRLMSEGTSRHNAQQLAEMVDYYGAYYETEQSTDYCAVVLHTLTKHFSSTLLVILEIITDAAFPEKELAVYKQNNKQRLTVENEKVGSVARRKFSEIIFGSEHGYGYYTKPEDYDKLSQAALQNFYNAHYVSNHCTIVISGKVNEDAFKVLNNILGRPDWSKGNGEVTPVTPFNSSTGKINYIEKEGAIQSAIRIGKPMFSKTHPDYAGMQVLNTLLGGYFGSRLMKNIREDKGYTYGIGSAVVSMIQGGYFFIASEVGADVCESALAEIYKEIEILKSEPVPAEELQMVKNYMLGSFLKSIDGAFNLADRWKGIMFYNLDYDYYQQFINTVKSVSSEDIIRLAQKYLQRESLYELVVGKK